MYGFEVVFCVNVSVLAWCYKTLHGTEKPTQLSQHNTTQHRASWHDSTLHRLAHHHYIACLSLAACINTTVSLFLHVGGSRRSGTSECRQESQLYVQLSPC